MGMFDLTRERLIGLQVDSLMLIAYKGILYLRLVLSTRKALIMLCPQKRVNRAIGCSESAKFH